MPVRERKQCRSHFGRSHAAEDDFVTREPHPVDRRATLVTFTKHGERTAKALEQDHIELARKVFDAMSETTFRGFTQGLDTVLARLYERLAETEAQRSRKAPRTAAHRLYER